MSFTTLAERVHLSTPAVIARVRKLQSEGVIRGYHADIDRAKTGRPVAIYVLLKCTRHGERRFREHLDAFPEITLCHLVTGEAAFIVFAALASMEHATEFLERLGAYGETCSGALLDSLPIPPKISTD